MHVMRAYQSTVSESSQKIGRSRRELFSEALLRSAVLLLEDATTTPSLAKESLENPR